MKLNLRLMPWYMYYKTSVASVLQPVGHSKLVCTFIRSLTQASENKIL